MCLFSTPVRQLDSNNHKQRGRAAILATLLAHAQTFDRCVDQKLQHYLKIDSHLPQVHPQCMNRDPSLWKFKIWRFFFYNTPASNYPTPPSKKKAMTRLLIKLTSVPQIDSRLHLNLEKNGRRFPKSSEDFLS